MDIFVYLILSVQIITGLYTAFFFRWGSSWFALVLTPYLRSIFAFNPDATAVIALPFIDKNSYYFSLCTYRDDPIYKVYALSGLSLFLLMEGIPAGDLEQDETLKKNLKTVWALKNFLINIAYFVSE